MLVQDNLDIACHAIERAAMDRAILDVDDSFANAFEIRRRHREVRLLSLLLAAQSPHSFLATSWTTVLGSAIPSQPLCQQLA